MTFLNTIRNWFYGTPSEHRCGLAEPLALAAGKPNLWKLRELQWFRMEGPNNIPLAEYDREIEKALARWTINPPGFTFKRATKDADANLLFRAADPPLFNFDYAGTIVENASQPYKPDFVNQLVIALRKTANWGTGIIVNKLNLAGALTHGIGHTLGLAHDEKPGNLMYHKLTHISEPTARDIQRFQALYAVTPGPVPPPVTPVPAFIRSRVEAHNRVYEGNLPLVN